MGLSDEYIKRCKTNSDINELLPVLLRYANSVCHITEFGVREGNSTIALASGSPLKLVSYDIAPVSRDLINLVKESVKFEFFQKDVLQVEIEETDLLFIDTKHTYLQLIFELEKHHSKVRKFIILHDTEAFGVVGEDGTEGLNKAIEEFLGKYKQWRVIEKFNNNNGLTVLRNIS